MKIHLAVYIKEENENNLEKNKTLFYEYLQ